MFDFRSIVRDLPSGNQPPEPHHTLGDSIAIGALAVTLITWVLVPSLLARGVTVLIAAMLLTYLAYRSHFVRTWPIWVKNVVAVILVAVLVAAAAAQLIPQWKSERETESGNPQVNNPPLTSSFTPEAPKGPAPKGGTVNQAPPVNHRTAEPKKRVARVETASAAPVAAPAPVTPTPASSAEDCPPAHGLTWTHSTIQGGTDSALSITGNPGDMNFCDTTITGTGKHAVSVDSGKPADSGQRLLPQPPASPGLHLKLNQYGFAGAVVGSDGVPIVDPNGVTAVVIATVSNLGAPSVANDWALSIKLPGQETTLKPPLMAFNIPNAHTMSLGPGFHVSLDKLLYKETMSPLATGDQKQGVLTFFVAGKTMAQMKQIGTTMILTCHDVSGNMITSDPVAFRGGGKHQFKPSLGLE